MQDNDYQELSIFMLLLESDFWVSEGLQNFVIQNFFNLNKKDVRFSFSYESLSTLGKVFTHGSFCCINLSALFRLINKNTLLIFFETFYFKIIVFW